MTKHDEVRQILHEAGFKFIDGRTALGMTDAEVEEFLVKFASVMTEFGRQIAAICNAMLRSFNHVIKPYHEDLGRILADSERMHDEGDR